MKSPITLDQATKAGQALRRTRDDPVGFVRAFFHVEPDEWQAEMLNAVGGGENTSTRSGHGVGKTAAMAWLVLWYLSTRPYCKIPCTAPTNHQLSDLLWAEIAYWLNRSPLKHLITWTATRVGMIGKEESWFAVARSCAKPENLAGFHAPFLLYIVDEASGVPDQIMATVDGALTTPNAQIAMAGNPTRRSGYFFDSHHRARSAWHTLHVSSEDAKQVSPEYPSQMALKWGKDSDIYRVRVQGEFPAAESDSFIRLDLVEAAVQRWLDAKPDGICELGVDVARYGDDETVFCTRKGGYILPLEAQRQWATTQTSARAVQLAREAQAAAIKIDDTGVGGGVTDQVSDAVADQGLDTMVVPVNFGGAGDDEGHYDNYATVMWAKARDMLISGDLALPNDEDLIAQLTTRKYKVTPKGKIRLESKDEVKKRGLPSPDRADALVLALAGETFTDLEIRTGSRKRDTAGMI